MGHRGRKRVQLSSLGSLEYGMREKGRLPSKSWSPLNALLSYFILIPKKTQIANSSPDPSFHIMGVYLLKSSLSRSSNDPSQSGKHLEVPSLFQIRLWNTRSACVLISSLDRKENSFPFRQKNCLPVFPIPPSSSNFPSSPGLFLSKAVSGVGENVLYISFTLFFVLQSSDSPPATSPLPTSDPLNSSPPIAWLVLACLLSHFYVFSSSLPSSSIIPTLRRRKGKF